MDEDLWINKYEPKTVKEIAGNGDAINDLKKWVHGFRKGKGTGSIIVSGNRGVGKSLAVRLALQEMGYNVKTLHSDDLKGTNVIEELIKATEYSVNICDLVLGREQTDTALIVDDTETITLRSDKNSLTKLYKDNEEERYFPIVFISNFQHSKFTQDIKKTCPEIKFKNPSKETLQQIIKEIAKKEKMKIKSDSVIQKIVAFSQKDIRRLIYILQDLYYTYQKKSITDQKIDDFIVFTQRKNKEVGLFDATKRLLGKYTDIDSSLTLYETEKVLLPLMVHENYYKSVLKRGNIDKLETMREISDNISMGDVIETHIYTDQSWYLQNIYGFFTCVETSYQINKNGPDDSELNIKFSSDLTKTSLKNINKKNITNLKQLLPYKSIDDIIHINMMMHHLVKNKEFEKIGEIIRGYDITPKQIEVAIKIDKTKEKQTITSKNKRFILGAMNAV